MIGCLDKDLGFGTVLTGFYGIGLGIEDFVDFWIRREGWGWRHGGDWPWGGLSGFVWWIWIWWLGLLEVGLEGWQGGLGGRRTGRRQDRRM